MDTPVWLAACDIISAERMFTSRQLLHVLGTFVLFASAWSLSGRSGITGTYLDQSYPLVVEHAASRHAQFGKDIVYTLGPLGYLYPSSQGLGGFVWQRVACACLLAAFSAFVCMQLLRGTWLPLRVLMWLWFVLYPPSFTMLCAGAALVLMDQRNPPSSWVSWLLPAVAGLAAMVKFTDLMSGAAMTGAVALAAALRREPWPAIRPLVSFGGAALTAWLYARQSLANLPAYLRNSLEVATGFAAMTFSPQPWALALGVAGVALLLLGAMVALGGSQHRQQTALCLLPVLACGFLSWKHGFVRADSHVVFFFTALAGYAQMISIAGGTARPLAIAIAVVAWGVSAGGTWVGGMPMHRVLAEWPGALVEKLHWRVAPIASTPPELLARARLPQIQKVVGNAPVDIWGHQQAFAFLNGLNLHPRPVFQSFCAYTPRLQDLNLAWYQSSTRPRYVLFQPETLDRRWAWLDDGPLALDLLTQWSPVLREKGFILLEPGLSTQPPGKWRENGSGDLKWGKKIKVPAHGLHTLISLEVNCSRSLWGKVKRFSYQGSHLSLRVWMSNGTVTNRNFIPEMARRPVLLSPALESTDDVLAWQTGLLEPARVTQFSLEPWPGAEREFGRGFHYKFRLWSETTPMDRTELAARLRPQLHPYLPALPELMKPALLPVLVEGVEIGQARAPSYLKMQVPDKALGLTGQMSIQRTDPSTPEVITVRTVLSDGENRELAAREHRLNDPAQGTVDLVMDFPSAASTPATVRHLTLEATSSLPKNRAWVAWGPIRWKLK